MEIRRWLDEYMRTRTALVLFLTSMVLGGLLMFAVGSWADSGTDLVASAGTSKAAKKSPQWRSLAVALEEAGQKEKPVLVDVYTSWCGWCKRMDKYTYGDEQVQALLEDLFVPVKMDAESKEKVTYSGEEYTYRQIAKGFKITGYPATLFLAADGSYITKVPGFMKPEQFITVLRYIGEGHYKSKTYQDFTEELELSSN